MPGKENKDGDPLKKSIATRKEVGVFSVAVVRQRMPSRETEMEERK